MSELSDALRAQRIELAGDVHDRVIPPLFAARMRLEALITRLEPSGRDAAAGATETVIAELQQAAELIELAIAKSRQLLLGLAPHEPGQQHWDTQLRLALGDPMRTLQQTGDLPWERIADDATVLLTSIAEEAIRNAVRHGGARRIDIQVSPVANQDGAAAAGDARQLYELAIQDDGQGFDPHQSSDHHGLHLMRLRAAALGGQLTLASQPGGPTRVLLRWPVPKAS
jgi:signal transduction histidine kinase